MNRKGQALIEFVLILPVIIILLFASIDIFNIISKKSELDNKVQDTVEIYKQKNLKISELKKILTDKNLETTIMKNEQTNLITIEVEEKISFTTPFMNNILDDYKIKVKRVIPSE